MDMEPTRGRIIILNGTSSSGKSTTARELIAMLEPIHYHLGIDHFRTSGPQERLGPDEFDHLVRGFHRAVAGFAAAGNHVVMDHLLGEQWRVQDCVKVFAGFDVWLVGLHCSAEELRRRERVRNGRSTGRGESQLASIHAYVEYDIELDTEDLSPQECAAAIAAYLEADPRPRAFSRLT